jgi:hypothetical protein
MIRFHPRCGGWRQRLRDVEGDDDPEAGSPAWGSFHVQPAVQQSQPFPEAEQVESVGVAGLEPLWIEANAFFFSY